MELCQVDLLFWVHRPHGGVATSVSAVYRAIARVPGCALTRARAQLASSGHLSAEYLGSGVKYRGVKVKSVQVTWHIKGAGTLN